MNKKYFSSFSVFFTIFICTQFFYAPVFGMHKKMDGDEDKLTVQEEQAASIDEKQQAVISQSLEVEEGFFIDMAGRKRRLPEPQDLSNDRFTGDMDMNGRRIREKIEEEFFEEDRFDAPLDENGRTLRVVSEEEES